MICSRCKTETPDDQFVIGAVTKGKQYRYCKSCLKKDREKFNQTHPTYQREWYLEKKRRGHFQTKRLKQFGLTQKEYDDLFEFQGKKCAICDSVKPADKKGWALDHDHIFGDTRGLLCKDCNTGLGHFKDSLTNLRRAMEYLTDPPLKRMREAAPQPDGDSRELNQ